MMQHKSVVKNVKQQLHIFLIQEHIRKPSIFHYKVFNRRPELEFKAATLQFNAS